MGLWPLDQNSARKKAIARIFLMFSLTSRVGLLRQNRKCRLLFKQTMRLQLVIRRPRIARYLQAMFIETNLLENWINLNLNSVSPFILSKIRSLLVVVKKTAKKSRKLQEGKCGAWNMQKCCFCNNCFVWFLTSLISHFLPQSREGFLKTGVRPQSFPNESLLCKVEVGNDEYNDVTKGWIYERAYREHYARFRQV